MRTLLAFVTWIFSKIGEGLIEQHKEFKRSLVHETGVTIFVWFVVTLFSSIVVFLVLLGTQYVTGIQIPVETWFGYIFGCVFYFLYTAVSVMYNAFKAERAELFEIIKNGK